MNDVGSNNHDAVPDLEMRVLILAPTSKDLDLTQGIFKRAEIEAYGCETLGDLTRSLRKGVGAVLVGEEAISGTDGSPLKEYLAGQPSWSDLPVLVLASPGADSTGVARAMDEYGNVTVLERPMRVAALVSAVRSALRARTRQYQVRDDAHELQKAHDLLEHRVSERTIELHQTNKMLEEKAAEAEAAEERAHLLLRQLVTAQESERARIARDLHDELGQQVTSLRLHLSQIERDLSTESRANAQTSLAAIDHEAEKIDSQISFLAWKIRPTTIEEMGLAKALRGYIREWSRNFDVAADFRGESKTKKRLLPEIETNIYRIAQESLNNVAKYADARSVAVLLTTNEKETSLIIEDDGKGFDSDSPDPRRPTDGGLGIQGMHERAALLGGNVQIESTPTQGTTVFVRIPAKFR